MYISEVFSELEPCSSLVLWDIYTDSPAVVLFLKKRLPVFFLCWRKTTTLRIRFYPSKAWLFLRTYTSLHDFPTFSRRRFVFLKDPNQPYRVKLCQKSLFFHPQESGSVRRFFFGKTLRLENSPQDFLEVIWKFQVNSTLIFSGGDSFCVFILPP